MSDAFTTDGVLPDHIQTLSTLAGDAVYRCQTCGSEAELIGQIDHHEECPEQEGNDA